MLGSGSTPLTHRCSDIETLFDIPVFAHRLAGIATAEDVHPEERRHVETASPRRQADFYGGRACAAQCHADLGAPSGPIGIGLHRMPIWPEGIAGSISHCSGYCAAVAGWKGPIRSLGIDVEESGRVSKDLEHVLLTPAESERLAGANPADWSALATVLFSAKEAFFKAQFPLTELFLDFKDASLVLGDGTFSLALERDVSGLGSAGSRFQGRFRVSGDHILTAVGL